MMHRSLERQFLRFQRRGDPAGLATVFDRTAAEVLRVAMHLSRDPADAEDLVQRTFLTAIERSASFDARERLVPWLLGILANHAREAARRDRRTVDPTRLRAHQTPDPASVAAFAEGAAEADRAIDALPDPYRSVLVLRFRHGMEPAEIANALGLPPGTVRSHIHRGLERVKRAVPSGLACAALLDTPVVRGLPAVRAMVLKQAVGTTASLAGLPAAATSAATGGLLMGKKFLVTGALLLFFVGGAALWWAGRPSPDDQPSAPPTLSAELLADTGLAARATAPAAPATASASASAKTASPTRPGRGEIVAHVTWADGSPAAGIGVTLIDWSDPHPFLDRRLLVTGPDGSLEGNDLRPGVVGLYPDRGGGKSTEVGANEISEPSPIVIPAGVAVDGVVADEKGPVAGAEVWWATDWNSMTIAATADAEGRFRLRDVGGGKMLSARAADRPFSARHYVWGKPGETVSMRIEVAGAGAAVVGHVTDQAGRPVPGAIVLAGQERGFTIPLPDGRQGVTPPAILGTADGAGAYRIDGVAVGDVPIAARAPGFAPWIMLRAKVKAGEGTRIDIQLELGATVSGTVTDEAGKAAAGALVLEGEYALFASSLTTVGSDGSYSLADLAPGSIALRAVSNPKGPSREGSAPTKAEGVVRVVAGGTGRWDATLGAGLRILGRVIDENGAPLARYMVEGQEDGDRTAYRVQAWTDAEGRFTLANSRDVPHLLTALDPRSTTLKSQTWPLARVHGIRPGPEDVVLRVRSEDRPSAHIIGKVIGPDGAPLGGASVSLLNRRNGRGVVDYTEVGSGRFALGPVSPGAYEVSVEASGMGRVGFGTSVVRQGERKDLGGLELRPPGTLVVEVVLADGTPAPFATVLATGERAYRAIRADQGTGRDAFLPPGRYALRVEGVRYSLATEACIIVSGQETPVRLTVVPGAFRRFVLSLPEGDRDANVATIRLRREADRALLFEGDLSRSREGTFGLGEYLAVGRYRVEAETDSGLMGEATFEVKDLSPAPPDEIRISLSR